MTHIFKLDTIASRLFDLKEKLVEDSNLQKLFQTLTCHFPPMMTAAVWAMSRASPMPQTRPMSVMTPAWSWRPLKMGGTTTTWYPWRPPDVEGLRRQGPSYTSTWTISFQLSISNCKYHRPLFIILQIMGVKTKGHHILYCLRKNID